MKSISECFARVKKRPVIFLFLALTTLLFCALEQYNPFTQEYGSLKSLFGRSFLGVLADFAQKIAGFFSQPGTAALSILIALVIVLAVSVVLGVLYAGFGQTMYCAVTDQKRKKGEFLSGISRHFGKLTVYFFLLIVMTILFIVLFIFALVPAMMTIKILFSGNSGVIFQMLLLCILTVAILYFAAVFYAMYFSFMLPSLVGFKRGGFVASLKMVNNYCWYLLPRTTLFLFLMALIRVGLFAIGYGLSVPGLSVVVLLGAWLLRLICLFPYLYFLFNTFVAMKEDLYPEAA